ncbi:MAG TPA: amino acid permease [Candidatus Sulfotelmatobacter sp.]|jgi:L-asparagine transporter-like permease|nr:amino acid permease [Candidatus Sulfotelmatobacter sp.]
MTDLNAEVDTSLPDQMSGTPAGVGLQRRLSQRQLTMMAIGGAIGVGLFLGSRVTIRLAGPAVILSYLLGAGIALIMSYTLAEMAVVHPEAGAFGVYAEKYLSPWAGFTVRATYGAAQIIAIGAEVTAAGIYISFWFPHVPQWIWVVTVSAALIALNSMQVNRLGEFEYWFAMIKVAAIILFIIVGLALIFGDGSRGMTGYINLTQHGGFLPSGWKGVWLSLTITITSYMGVEVIAVTAGEAERPEVTIPHAMRNIVWRLILFYVLAITIMVAMVPWVQAGDASGLSGSPFVTAFAAAHIPFAAAIMNFVVLTAALSSVNTNLYLSTRMLFSLGNESYAPAWMGKVSSNGVPHRALLASTAGIIAAIVLAIFAPKNAFLKLYGSAVAGMFFVWLVILCTHLRFRRTISTDRLISLPMRLRAHPFFTLAGIAILLAISITTFFVDGLEWSVPVFCGFLGLISLLYLRARQRKA